MMLLSAYSILRFDAFSLDPVRCVLMRGSSVVPLRRQSFEVLRYLAEHAGKVVSSEELIEAVWVSKPADHKTSAGQCIKEIRRALGDESRWIIKTVSGRGYEFTAQVVPRHPSPPEVATSASELLSVSPNPEVGAQSQARSPASARATTIRETDGARSSVRRSYALRWHQKVFATVTFVLVVTLGATSWLRPRAPMLAPTALTMMAAPTIAVLSFTGTDGGLADELRSALGARAHQGFGLTVKAADVWDRAFVPKEDRPRLGVRYAVLGATLRDGDVHHSSIQLLELETDVLIWSESFDTRLGEPSALEHLAARIARLITFQVAAVESRRPLPERREAGHFVILGRALLDGERGSSQMRDALVYFERALELDSKSIFALYGLAVIKINQVRNGWIPLEARPAALNQAETAIERIIRIDHRNASAHWLRGFLLRERGDMDHAIAALEHALSLNPKYSLALAELGRTKIDAGRAREGLRNIEEAIGMSPTDPTIFVRYHWAGMAAVHLEDYQTAVTWLLKARQANRNYAITMQWLAVAYLGVGDEEKARAVMTEYLGVSPGFSIVAWKRSMGSSNAIVIEQRKRIEDALRRLGVPEGGSVAAQN